MNTDNNLETNVKQAVPFFGVTNMSDSVRFYVDGLGFKITKRWEVEGALRWCWIAIGDAAIMLQEFVNRRSWRSQAPGEIGPGGNDQLPVHGCPGDLPRGCQPGSPRFKALCGQWHVGHESD